MLKIGEFSSLTQVSIKALRHYDDIGLLKPLHVDAETGYRYYSASQPPRLHRILALKDLGFPLDRIAKALEEGVSADAVRGMLMLRRIEQEDRVQEEVERLVRLKTRLRLIELEGILRHLQKRDRIEARLLDLRDFPSLSSTSLGRPPYEHEVVKRWTAEIAASDGYVFVTPEYNFGPSAVLKNAIDWVYPEWNRKPAGFVSYGSLGGARSVQQLREVAAELQMAPIRWGRPHSR